MTFWVYWALNKKYERGNSPHHSYCVLNKYNVPGSNEIGESQTDDDGDEQTFIGYDVKDAVLEHDLEKLEKIIATKPDLFE